MADTYEKFVTIINWELTGSCSVWSEYACPPDVPCSRLQECSVTSCWQCTGGTPSELSLAFQPPCPNWAQIYVLCHTTGSARVGFSLWTYYSAIGRNLSPALSGSVSEIHLVAVKDMKAMHSCTKM
jgi:hypothetical protein